MGITFAIKNVYSDAPLTLSQIGKLPDDTEAFFDFSGPSTYLIDKSGNGHSLTVDSTANNFSWSNGVLSANGAGAAILRSNVLRGAGSIGNNFTAIFAYRSRKDGLSYLLTDADGRGVSMYRTSNRIGYVYSASPDGGNNKTGEGQSATGKSSDTPIMGAISCDNSKIYLSVDGAPWGVGSSIDPAGIYSLLPTSTVSIGDQFQQTNGDLFCAVFIPRKITDNELSSAYLFMRNILVQKGAWV